MDITADDIERITTVHILPYLNFDGSAREAMEFYADVLGAELSVVTFGQGGAVPADSPFADKVMHSAVVGDGVRIYASDWVPEFCGGAPYAAGSDVTTTLEGGQEDADRLRAIYERLAEGGEVFMPLGKQDWGDEFGSLRDRFGKGWNIAIQAPKA